MTFSSSHFPRGKDVCVCCLRDDMYLFWSCLQVFLLRNAAFHSSSRLRRIYVFGSSLRGSAGFMFRPPRRVGKESDFFVFSASETARSLATRAHLLFKPDQTMEGGIIHGRAKPNGWGPRAQKGKRSQDFRQEKATEAVNKPRLFGKISQRNRSALLTGQALLPSRATEIKQRQPERNIFSTEQTEFPSGDLKLRQCD